MLAIATGFEMTGSNGFMELKKSSRNYAYENMGNDSRYDTFTCYCSFGSGGDPRNTTSCGTSFANPSAPSCTSSSQSIVGSSVAKIESWPWQVYIKSSRHINLFCGGSIIGPRLILTSANCVFGSAPNELTVRAGTQNVSELEGIRMNVYQVIIHPAYQGGLGINVSLNANIALLVLNNTFTYSHKIRAVCLPRVNETVISGEPCYATGWGITRNASIAPRQTLQEICLPSISEPECVMDDRLQSTNLTLTNNTFCAGYSADLGLNKGICNGDIGGPYVCKSGNTWKLRGISSWYIPTCGQLSIFTDVSKYIAWISNYQN
ncbi:unnamed protein product [Gordionus sp. m RMFG-2023]